MSAGKYSCIFLHQMEAILYVFIVQINFKPARPFTIAMNMRLLKFFVMFAFLLCLMEPCFLKAEGKPHWSGITGGGSDLRIRFTAIS